MNDIESAALKAAAVFYQLVPDYVIAGKNKELLERALIEAIDALDVVEYSRTTGSLLAPIQHKIPYWRKRVILEIVETYGLTSQESHILRYLANGRSAKYIADVLKLSIHTVRSHKYSIFKKLNVHTNKELEDFVSARLE